jgi:hypothetical protein
MTGPRHAATVNEGARESVRQLAAGHPGWMIAYHEGRGEFSATRPGLVITRYSAAALDTEMSRWEQA